MYQGLPDFTLGMDDSPNVWKIVHYLFVKPVLFNRLCLYFILFGAIIIVSARLWELYNYFSCGKVIKTAFFFCVPDYCTLHLFGGKIK